MKHLRAVLDVVATLAMIAAAGLVAWAMVYDRSTETPPSAGLPAEPVSLAGAALLGSPSAPVAIIQYSDFECPFCGRFAREVLPSIQANFLSTGKAKMAFRHLPLAFHKFARAAAAGAECAGQQGKFWEMHDLLFRSPKLDDSVLEKQTDALALDRERFALCLKGPAIESVLARDEASAKALAIRGTPTFLIGVTTADGSVKVSKRLNGARTAADFEAAIKELLRSVN